MLQTRVFGPQMRSLLTPRHPLHRYFSSALPRSSPTSSAPTKPNRFSQYLLPLRQKHPNIDPASLIASFLILHELTAIVPLFLGFLSFKSLGLGIGLLSWVVSEQEQGDEPSWIKTKVERWIHEGETRAQRIGRRYGVFGFEKDSDDQRQRRREAEKKMPEGEKQVVDFRVGGDVANLVASYLVVKALLPLRIYASLRLAPALANSVMGRFHRLRAIGARYVRKKGPDVPT